MTAQILQFPGRRVHCDPQLPPDYEPYQTSEQREAERMRSFDAAEAYARRRDGREIDMQAAREAHQRLRSAQIQAGTGRNDDGPQAA